MFYHLYNQEYDRIRFLLRERYISRESIKMRRQANPATFPKLLIVFIRYGCYISETEIFRILFFFHCWDLNTQKNLEYLSSISSAICYSAKEEDAFYHHFVSDGNWKPEKRPKLCQYWRKFKKASRNRHEKESKLYYCFQFQTFF